LKFKVGDIVVAYGSTLTIDGSTDKHCTLALVVEVGKRDLFLQEGLTKSGKPTLFKLPASRCAKVSDDNIRLSSQLLKPKIGDLVISIESAWGSKKIEKNVGVLKAIIDYPGKYKTAILQIGTKTETVIFDTLIVAENSGE
jgi:hypothetical protein